MCHTTFQLGEGEVCLRRLLLCKEDYYFSLHIVSDDQLLLQSGVGVGGVKAHKVIGREVTQLPKLGAVLSARHKRDQLDRNYLALPWETHTGVRSHQWPTRFDVNMFSLRKSLVHVQCMKCRHSTFITYLSRTKHALPNHLWFQCWVFQKCCLAVTHLDMKLQTTNEWPWKCVMIVYGTSVWWNCMVIIFLWGSVHLNLTNWWLTLRSTLFHGFCQIYFHPPHNVVVLIITIASHLAHL